MAKFDAHLKCSFCGKSQDQVRKLIAGPGVYICDECIDLCNEILDEELVDGQGNPRHSHEPSRKATPAARKSSKPAPTLASIPRPQDIKIDDKDVDAKIKEVKKELSADAKIDPERLRQAVMDDLMQDRLMGWLEENSTLTEKAPAADDSKAAAKKKPDAKKTAAKSKSKADAKD